MSPTGFDTLFSFLFDSRKFLFFLFLQWLSHCLTVWYLIFKSVVFFCIFHFILLWFNIIVSNFNFLYLLRLPLYVNVWSVFWYTAWTSVKNVYYVNPCGIKSQDFISMDECYSPVFMHHVVSSEADGHISCWNLSTIVKSATVDTGVWYIWLLDNLNLIKTGSFSFLCFTPVALDPILQKTIID